MACARKGGWLPARPRALPRLCGVADGSQVTSHDSGAMAVRRHMAALSAARLGSAPVGGTDVVP